MQRCRDAEILRCREYRKKGQRHSSDGNQSRTRQRKQDRGSEAEKARQMRQKCRLPQRQSNERVSSQRQKARERQN